MIMVKGIGMAKMRTMIEVIKSAQKGDRLYHLADTAMGRILFYQFDKYTQWKNLTNHDILWTIKPTVEFERIHKFKPIETFAAGRKMMFLGEKVKVKCGDEVYWLAELKKSDGYLYEIPATLFRLLPKSKYPNQKFPYTRYRIEAVEEMDFMMLQRLKIEEVMRYNGHAHHSPHVVSSICEAVYDYCKGRKEHAPHSNAG